YRLRTCVLRRRSCSPVSSPQARRSSSASITLIVATKRSKLNCVPSAQRSSACATRSQPTCRRPQRLARCKRKHERKDERKAVIGISYLFFVSRQREV